MFLSFIQKSLEYTVNVFRNRHLYLKKFFFTTKKQIPLLKSISELKKGLVKSSN